MYLIVIDREHREIGDLPYTAYYSTQLYGVTVHFLYFSDFLASYYFGFCPETIVVTL